MASIIVNANGTVSESFSIGKSGKGIVIYQGDSFPSSLLGNTGDIFIKRTTEPLLMKKNSSGWVNVSNKDVKTISSSSVITPLQSETIYLVDSSSGTMTITISSSSVESGKSITIKDSKGQSQINNIIINTEGVETIDDNDSVSIQSNYTAITLISDGMNWFII
jgi:hypothetical protein